MSSERIRMEGEIRDATRQYVSLLFDENSMRILMTLSLAHKPLAYSELAELSGIPSSTRLDFILDSLRRSAIVQINRRPKPSYTDLRGSYMTLTEGGEIIAKGLPKLLDDSIRDIEKRYGAEDVRGGTMPHIFDEYKMAQSRLREFQDNVTRKLKEKRKRKK